MINKAPIRHDTNTLHRDSHKSQHETHNHSDHEGSLDRMWNNPPLLRAVCSTCSDTSRATAGGTGIFIERWKSFLK